MPAKTKSTKASKACKENIFINNPLKNIQTKTVQASKPPRRVLGDKTNSASDDNISILITEKPLKTVSIKKKVTEPELKGADATKRPRRARRIPTRYIENVSINNLSPKKSCSPSVTIKKTTPGKKGALVVLSPPKIHDNSLVINRPRRICRLPSRFDDQLTSPNKLSVQPINASTPIANKTKNVNQGSEKLKSKQTSQNVSKSREVITKKKSTKNGGQLKNTPINKSSDQPRITNFLKKKNADSNNNAKNNLSKSPKTIPESPVINSNKGQSKTERNKRNRILNHDSSFRVLDNKKSLKRNSSKLDVYEFTFDPSEEPPAAKKKKKRNVARKTKPKKVTFKSNYEKNLAKALATLKNAVAHDHVQDKHNEKTTDIVNNTKNDHVQNKHNEKTTDAVNNTKTDKNIPQPVSTDNNLQNDGNQTLNQDGIHEDVEKNYNSVRVEDIALDIQHCDDLNYSPVNTPRQTKTPNECTKVPNISNVNDPLNLQDELSFFDEQPAASSSMNQSLRHPQASPWRVEFGSLPIKWQVNTYVKPNMTPALESSFINFNDSRKKHVYTSIAPPTNDSLPDVVESPNLKQTSIISFIKEVVEKNANKKKRKSTPVKSNSLFEDLTNTFADKENTTSKETSKNSKSSITPNNGVSSDNIINNSNTSNNNSLEENEIENASISNKNNKNVTYFGFDESEDQENARPTKKQVRSLRSRRRVLQEINTLNGPSRPVLPVAAKTKLPQNFDKANEIEENIKSATEPPVFPEMPIAGNTEINKDQSLLPDDNEDSQSVHLFEDIEMVHHHKPIRKSYSKRKKVAFAQKTVGSDSSDSENLGISSDDDLDNSFKLPSIKPTRTVKKRVTKKQKLSKKEEKEVEAWAAGFNSMCEDIDEFDLVVE